MSCARREVWLSLLTDHQPNTNRTQHARAAPPPPTFRAQCMAKGRWIRSNGFGGSVRFRSEAPSQRWRNFQRNRYFDAAFYSQY
eukprot:745853-Hanusia_phi.AAC.2